jgi:hypothetical protein
MRKCIATYCFSSTSSPSNSLLTLSVCSCSWGLGLKSALNRHEEALLTRVKGGPGRRLPSSKKFVL